MGQKQPHFTYQQPRFRANTENEISVHEASSDNFKMSKVSEEPTATVCHTHDNELSVGSESHYDHFQQQMMNEMIS